VTWTGGAGVARVFGAIVLDVDGTERFLPFTTFLDRGPSVSETKGALKDLSFCRSSAAHLVESPCSNLLEFICRAPLRHTETYRSPLRSPEIRTFPPLLYCSTAAKQHHTSETLQRWESNEAENLLAVFFSANGIVSLSLVAKALSHSGLCSK
jgi:hypothetical protein